MAASNRTHKPEPVEYIGADNGYTLVPSSEELKKRLLGRGVKQSDKFSLTKKEENLVFKSVGDADNARKMGDNLKAVQIYTQVMNMGVANLQLMFHRAIAFTALGDFEEAIKDLDLALYFPSISGKQASQVYMLRAKATYMQNEKNGKHGFTKSVGLDLQMALKTDLDSREAMKKLTEYQKDLEKCPERHHESDIREEQLLNNFQVSAMLREGRIPLPASLADAMAAERPMETSQSSPPAASTSNSFSLPVVKITAPAATTSFFNSTVVGSVGALASLLVTGIMLFKCCRRPNRPVAPANRVVVPSRIKVKPA